MQSPIGLSPDTRLTLQGFSLADLAPYTREGAIPPAVDHWLFYVGRDDVHAILVHLLSRVTLYEKGNMFGFDDEALNDLIWASVIEPTVLAQWTLDKSQAGGVHEKKILDADLARNAAEFNAHFAVISSSTGQISHTKGAVLDGVVGFEGSTNWSASGEGTFLSGKTAPGGPGYKAQNNTLMVFTDAPTIIRFGAELDAEHLSARASGGALTRSGG